MSLELNIMEKYVLRGLEEFDTNPLASQLLRRLSSEAPELFYRVATAHLCTGAESNAHRMLSMTLLRQDHLFERLASPLYGTHEKAVKLLRRLLDVDPSADVKFAKKLPGRNLGTHTAAFDSLRCSRALDILDETSRGRRLLPILGHLPESHDSRIAAKATLFVGRRVQNPNWSRKQLERGDERVRANAVEALWGVNTPPATRLLEDCMDDRNNRVVGNALVGLHIVGQEEARQEVISVSKDRNPDLRCTAAWAMGKLAEPDFAPRLAEMVHDEHSGVRGSALRSLIIVRRVEKALAEPATNEKPAEPRNAAAEHTEKAVEKATADFRIPSWAMVS